MATHSNLCWENQMTEELAGYSPGITRVGEESDNTAGTE